MRVSRGRGRAKIKAVTWISTITWSFRTFTLTWIQPPAEPQNVKYNICSAYYMTDSDKHLNIENKTESMNALCLGEF